MSELKCIYCKKIIIENWEEYEKKEDWIECPYCRGIFKIPEE